MSNKSELEMQGVCGCPCHDPHGVVAQCSCYHGDFREFREELKVAEDMRHTVGPRPMAGAG